MTRKRKNADSEGVEEIERKPNLQNRNVNDQNSDRFPTELVHYLRQMAKEVPEPEFSKRSFDQLNIFIKRN